MRYAAELTPMRPIRALLPILCRQSPIALAREAAWRFWKPYRTAHLLSVIKRGGIRLHFRAVPYYKPSLRALAEETAAVVSYADQICAGNFPFFGYETVHLGVSPRWNVDFISGFEWENIPSARLHPVVRHNGSDVKVPWELSRLQYLPVLAKAHLLTSESRYREAAKDLFRDWRAKNPVGVGVNWTLAMESALRGMSLCFLLSLLQPIQSHEQAWAEEVKQSIWQHLIYTESQLEFSHLIRGNHYLSNIVGLHCMATFLDGPGMERRRRDYRLRVQREIFRQVYEDGGDCEASFSYHLLVLQLFASAYLLMRADEYVPMIEFGNRLAAMFRFLSALADEDGRVPHVGDSDDGRVELLVSDLKQMVSLPHEERDSLLIPGYVGLGDALFNLNSCCNFSEAAWYGLSTCEKTRVNEQVAIFPHSGVAICRNEDAHVVFCAIPNGIEGSGSHTHNDKLSAVVRIRGHELFCDSGTYWYTRNAHLRNRYRSTFAHNTIAVDSCEQNEIETAPEFVFSIANQAKVDSIEIVQTLEEIQLSSTHYGYNRLGLKHRRSLRILSRQLVVEDTLNGKREYDFELFWHLPSCWRVGQGREGGGFQISGPVEVELRIESNVLLKCFQEPADISRSYGGATQRGTRLRISGKGTGVCTLTSNVTW